MKQNKIVLVFCYIVAIVSLISFISLILIRYLDKYQTFFIADIFLTLAELFIFPLSLIFFFVYILRIAKNRKITNTPLFIVNSLNLFIGIVCIVIWIGGKNMLDHMEENDQMHREELKAIDHYSSEIMPANSYLIYEIGPWGRCKRISFLCKNSNVKEYTTIEETAAMMEISKDSIMQLTRLLQDADCIGLYYSKDSLMATGEIAYRRSGFGMYAYELQNKALNNEEIQTINSDYSALVYDRHMIYRYGSGAVGSEILPHKEKKIAIRLEAMGIAP